MSIVKAVFESLDMAELASLRLKSELKTIRHVDLTDEPYPSPTSSIGDAFNQTAADTRFADYYNYPVSYNENDPFLPRNSQYGYYEPRQRTATRITVQLDYTEIKSCFSLLRSIGGTKIDILSD